MNYFKINIILFFFLISFSIGFTQSKINPNGYNIFYFDNGKISSEGTMKDGKPDGYWKTYYQNGKLKSEGNRKNFQLDSLWKFYNEKGLVTTEFNYKLGKKNGFKNTYDEKENLVSKENYVDDVKSGDTYLFYESGKVKEKINFVNGREEGMCYEYAEDSTIITLLEYQMGFLKKQEKINRKDEQGRKQGVYKQFYDNAKLKSEAKYIDDKLDGFVKEYSKDGSLISAEKFANGKKQENVPELAKIDIKSIYFTNGRVKFSGGYKGDRPEGIHREYDTLGNVVAAKIYVDGYLTGEGIIDEEGKQQGKWKEFHSNGDVRSAGEYLEGKRIGEWQFFYTGNAVEQKGKYDKKGKAQGAWKWYHENGLILREESYLDGKQDGIMTEYSDSGNVITKGEYIDGKKDGPWMYQLNNYKEEGSYKGSERDGEWKQFYITSQTLRFVGKFIDGNPDGKHKFYYPNGKLNQEGDYKMGRKEGDWNFYTEDGLKFLTIWFENDEETKFDGIKIGTTNEVE